MEAGAGPGDGTPGKNNLEETSGDKAPKSDEESKGLFNTLFKQGRNLFTSPQRGEGTAATSAEGIEEADLTDATREFLAKSATKYIERTIQLGFKDVDDFDESKGSTFGDQMIEVLEKSLRVRVELEKQSDEAEDHIQNLNFHIQSVEVENAELASKNEILRLELQQAINAKQIAEETVKLAVTGRDGKDCFRGRKSCGGSRPILSYATANFGSRRVVFHRGRYR